MIMETTRSNTNAPTKFLLERFYGKENEFRGRNMQTMQVGSGRRRPRTQFAHALIRGAMASQHWKEVLLSLSGSLAEDIVEEMQEQLDVSKHCVSCAGQGARVILLRRLLTTLSRKSQVLPNALFVEGVSCGDRNAINGGGYADIYRGELDGRVVALKRLRTFTSMSPESESKIIRQAAAGLCYLHLNEIVHGDLHAGNVLIDSHFVAKLSDFGLAGFHGASSATQGSHTHGAIRFCAPELLTETPVHLSLASDIYSFGCFCLQAHTRQPPFAEVLNDNAVLIKLIQGAQPKVPPIPDTSSPSGFWEFVQRCWCANPNERPTSQSLVNDLPLRQSLFAMEDLESFSHPEWKLPTPQHNCSALLDQALHGSPYFLDPCCIGLLSVEQENDLAVEALLSRLVELGCPEAVLIYVRDHFTGQSVPVTPLISNTTRVVSRSTPHNSGKSAEQIATYLYQLSKELIELEQFEDALRHLRKVVNIHQTLAMDRPMEFQRTLSDSLYHLALTLAELGQHTQGVKFIEDSVALRRKFVSDHPGQPNAPLAESLFLNASYCLSMDKQREAVLLFQESIETFRPLAERDPKVYGQPLAESLSRLCATLCKLGRSEDGIGCGQEAVERLYALQQVNAGKFSTPLAESLFILAGCYSDLRDHSMAASNLSHVASVCRALAKEDPGIFDAPLAEFLHELGNVLHNLKRYEEATKASKEAVDLRQRMERTHPGTCTATLAASVLSLARSYRSLEEYAHALPHLQQAVSLYRVLIHETTDAFTPPLAESLYELSIILRELGRYAEGITAGTEAVQLRRDLEKVYPGDFKISLASSLHNLGLCYQMRGDKEYSKSFFQEAIDFYRTITQGTPEDFAPLLADSLRSMMHSCDSLGRHRDALGFANELVQVYRYLQHQQSAAYAPRLAESLSGLAMEHCLLGEHHAALPIFEEALSHQRALCSEKSAEFTPSLVETLSKLNIAFHEVGRFREGLEVATEAITILQNPVHAHSPLDQNVLAGLLYRLAKGHAQLGDLPASVTSFLQSRQVYRSLMLVQPTPSAIPFFMCLSELSDPLIQLGRSEEAVGYCREALQLLEIEGLDIHSPREIKRHYTKISHYLTTFDNADPSVGDESTSSSTKRIGDKLDREEMKQALVLCGFGGSDDPPVLAVRDDMLIPASEVPVTMPSVSNASQKRRKQPLNFACPVPGCGSTFTRHFNLKGESVVGGALKCEWTLTTPSFPPLSPFSPFVRCFL
ncbi:hypothetical protein NLI96_g8108 [Meripilus lineatus]|uniref:Protein kinase domain-containing protein n=1 Tax=Meripilus lineatus TaxID=2056292 RepID=A0AAD5YBF2_9APHY|nr:hypothetical protein NLI96_g8108 [Physisporinus lineatus]